ncbi:MAG: hypothetical protein IJS90_09690, partial [Clostridia bacterium]|nr:hypothetical protein [Clostridia bacterium]
LSENEILLIVPVRFTMADGNLTVKINCADIYVSPGNVLEKLSLMPYFGAFGEPAKAVEAAAEAPGNSDGDAKEAQEFQEAQEEKEVENYSDKDFLLVPDGCGALMYTGENDEQTQNLSFEVYGGEAGARVGCFGVKKGQSAFVGIIDGGSETATVKAMRPAANADGVYTVYPEFSLTPVSIKDGKYIYAEGFKGEISVTYKFLTGELCTYIEMASACREELIRSGMLSSKTLQSGVYPLNLSVVGSVDGTKKTRCTELEQAEDLLAVLKAKGVNSINLILDGFFENGLYSFDSGGVSVPGALGGMKALGGLCSYASTQSIDVYAGIDLLRTGSKLRAASSISGEAQKTYCSNPLSPYIGGEGKYQYLISPVYIEKNVIGFMNSLKKTGVSGYASGSDGIIYPDYKTGIGKADFIKLMKEHYASFAAQKKLLLRSADFCLIKNADVVTDVPFYTENPESETYEAVPFIPAVLHSTLVYSGAPANDGSIYTLELLKSVEYGASPYVRWIYDARSPLFYELNFSEISEFYANALKKLGDLSSQRITAHRKVEEGLYETTYSGGSIVYVNYNNHSVNVDNISVPPYDYLRIN